MMGALRKPNVRVGLHVDLLDVGVVVVVGQSGCWDI